MSSDLAEDRAPSSVACPRCQAGRLDPGSPVDGFVACPRCGHRAATPYVAEELWLEQQDSRLHTRLAWVRHHVVVGDALPEPAAAAAPPARVRSRHPLQVQTVLLSVGALLLVLAAVVFAAVAWDRLGAFGQVAALVVVVAALSAAAHALRVSYRSTAEALAAIAAGVAAVALVAAPRLGLGWDWMRDRPAGWAAIAFVLLAALAMVLAWVSRLVAWHVTVVAAVVAAAFSAALAAGGGSAIEPLGCAGLAVAAAAAVVLRPGRNGFYRHEALWVGVGVGALAVAAGTTAYQHLDQAGGWAAAWFVVAASAAAVAWPWPRAARQPQLVTTASSAVAGLAVGQALPLLAAGASLDSWVAAPVLALAGAALLAGAAVPRLVLPALVAGASLWVVSLPVVAATGGLTAGQASTYLGLVAATLLAGSFVPGRAVLAWGAALVGTASLWVVLADRQVSTLELYTGGAAVLLLIAGLLHHRAQPALGSLPTIGPALAVAVLPSALLAFAQARAGDDPARAACVIIVGAGLAVLGARLRVQAALLVGLAAVTVAGLGQVLALVDLVPRWLSLAVAGALLVAAGFTAERLGHAGRHAWRAARRMR